MKILSSSVAAIVLGSFTATQAQEQAFLNAPKETSALLKYGVEALTTYRSEYVYRGFDLAGGSLEFQLAGQVALSNTDTLDLGFYYGTADSDGDFTETAVFFDFSRNIGDLTYSAVLTLRDYSNSFFESGVDLGGEVSWTVNEHIDLTGSASYDTGAEGFYELSLDSYFTFDAGIGVVADYYSRSGVHQAFAKAAYTYNINDAVSLSPYLQLNLGIHDEAEDHVIAGAYFAVSF